MLLTYQYYVCTVNCVILQYKNKISLKKKFQDKKTYIHNFIVDN